MTPYYSDDLVTIYHGDCREILPALTADAMVTDPPYGIAWGRATWPDDPAAYPELMRWLVAEAERAVPDGWVFVFQAMLNAGRWHEWFPEGWRIFAACKNFAQMQPTEVQSGWDPAVFWRNGPRRRGYRVAAGTVTRDFHVGNVAGVFGKEAGHPSPRPLDTMRHLVLLATTPERPTVIDPFMGSGTTLAAAKQVSRRAIGIEIEERYCEVAARRCSQEVLGLDAA